MTDIFIPCILNKIATLYKVRFDFDNICDNGNANEYWEIPDIPNCKGYSPDFEKIYRKVESYFTSAFINAKRSAMFYFRPIDSNLLEGYEFELNYGNISILLGIFLLAAKEIMGLKI